MLKLNNSFLAMGQQQNKKMEDIFRNCFLSEEFEALGSLLLHSNPSIIIHWETKDFDAGDLIV